MALTAAQIKDIKDMNDQLNKAYLAAKKLKGNLKGNSSTNRVKDMAALALLVNKINKMLDLAKENSAKLTLPGGPKKFNGTLAEMVAMVPSPSTQASTQVVEQKEEVVTAPVVEQQGNNNIAPVVEQQGNGNIAPVVEQQGNGNIVPSSLSDAIVDEAEVEVASSTITSQLLIANYAHNPFYSMPSEITPIPLVLAPIPAVIKAWPLMLTNDAHNVAPVAEPTPVVTTPVVEQQGNGNIVPVVEQQQEDQVQAVKTSKKAKKAKKAQVKEEAQVPAKNSLTPEQVSTLNASLQHDFAKAKEFKSTLLGDSRLSAAEKNDKAHQLQVFVTAMEATLAKLKDNGSKVSYKAGKKKFDKDLGEMKVAIANQLNSGFTVTASTQVAVSTVVAPAPRVEQQQPVIVEGGESDKEEEVQNVNAGQPAATNVRHNVSFASLSGDISDDEYNDSSDDEDVMLSSGMKHSLFSPLTGSSSPALFASRQGSTPKETPIVAALNKEIARLTKASATTGITGFLWSSSIYNAKMLAAKEAMNSLEGGLTDESITKAMSNHDSALYKVLNTHTSIIFAFSLDCCGLSFSWQTRSVLNLEKAIADNASSLKHEPLILDTEDTEFDKNSYEL